MLVHPQSAAAERCRADGPEGLKERESWEGAGCRACRRERTGDTA